MGLYMASSATITIYEVNACKLNLMSTSPLARYKSVMHSKLGANTTFRVHLCLGTVNSQTFFLELAVLLLIGIFALPRHVRLPRLITASKEAIGLVYQKLDNPDLWQLVASLLSLPFERHITGGKSE